MLECNSYLDWKLLKGFGTAEKIFKEFPNLPRKMGTKFYIRFLKQIQEANPNNPPQGFNSNQIQNGQDIINNNDNDSHSQWGDLPDTLGELVKNQLDYQQKEAAKQVIKSRGKLPAELEEKLQELLTPKPPVFNWKAYFRRLLGIAFDVFFKKTRRKESLRFEDMYGLKRKKKHKLLVAIDTSGSVSESELQDFFSEIYHIWKAGASVHILECDADIHKEYDYDGKCPKTVSGRGGTSFKAPIEYYNQHRKEYTTMVYFTDGYGDQYDCKPLNKMMWVITSQGNQKDDSFPGIKICIPKK